MGSMQQDAATHQEHGDGAHHAQGFHQPGCEAQQPRAQTPEQPIQSTLPGFLVEHQSQVIDLDDTGDQAVHPYGHQQGYARQHQQLGEHLLPLDHSQGQHDNFRRENKIRPDRPPDFGPLQFREIAFRVR